MNNFQRVHLMGIAGAGMSALANLFLAKGLSVSGCDLQHSHYNLGSIPFRLGHSAQHLNEFNPEALILSSAVSPECEEVKLAKSRGIRILSRAQALSSLFNSSSGIGIAGAHGKTTTSSMIGLIFLKAGLDPTVYIGANVPDIGGNSVSGSGDYFIAELDESDGSFEVFSPQIAVITNADWDHVDHYKTRGAVIEAFTRFADGRKEDGALILCNEDEGAQKVFEACSKSRGRILRYGFGKSPDWGAYEISASRGGGISCKVARNSQELGMLELRVSGEHNILNALAAISAADLCGISFETSAEILRDFHGSERRMQIKGSTPNDILVMDDYAHHPSEISATLSAIRSIYPERRIVVVYQPHRFSRTAQFAPEIAKSLSIADEIFLLPVYSAGEKEISHSSADEIINYSQRNIAQIKIDDAVEVLKSNLKSGDLLLTMGAGDVYLLGEKFLREFF